MRFLGFEWVCLGVLSACALGCGPEPSVKQPESSAGANATTTPASSTAPVTSATSEQGSSGSPTPSATTSATTPPTNPTATTNTETTTLVGSLSNDEIQKAINDNIQAFDACYTLGADKQGKLEGTITIKATVGPLGTVKEATVQKSTMKNAKVDKCVADAFKKVKFPQPRGGVAIITYPMTFGGEVVRKK